jgi:hypothetical protein
MNAPILADKNSQMRSQTPPKILSLRLLAMFMILLSAIGVVFAGVTASISGTVTDSSGAAIVGATVTAANIDTGVAATQQTNGQGF